MFASPAAYALSALKRTCTRVQSGPAWIGYWIDFEYGERPSSNTNSVSPTLPSCGVSVRNQNVARIASPIATGAVVGVCSCTAHSWLDASLTVKRIASVNGCPVTGDRLPLGRLGVVAHDLEGGDPRAAQQVDARQAGDARVGRLLHRIGLVVDDGRCRRGGGAAGRACPTAAGGGAVRLMQRAGGHGHAHQKQGKSCDSARACAGE